MAIPVCLRGDFDAARLRGLAKKTKDGPQARWLLALAAIYDGATRTEALARMNQALDSFIIEGITTTIPFLQRVINHPDFVRGEVDTKFLERNPGLMNGNA